jgi:hypothetical protein
MITPYLEKLIHQGKAIYKTWACAYSSVYRVPVPSNCYVVIVDFTYYAPLQVGPGDQPPDIDALNRTAIYIRSQKSNNTFIHKPFITPLNTTPQEQFPQIQPFTFNTYIVCEGFIKISIRRLPMFSNLIGHDFVVLPDSVDEENKYYGTTSSPVSEEVPQNIDLDGSNIYNPQTSLSNPGNGNTNEPYSGPIVNGLANFNAGLNCNDPMFNFSYVQIQGKPEHLLSSS